MTHRARRAVLALLLTLGVYAAGAPSALAGVLPGDTETPGALVVIGTGGITVDDITADATPNLWHLFTEGSAAVMTLSAATRSTCPVDGWLSLSAGTGVTAPRDAGTDAALCPAILEPTPVASSDAVEVPGWATYRSAAEEHRANIGTLGQRLAAAPACVKAIGPGAALAAAGPDGRAARYSPYSVDSLIDDLATCPVTFVDVGSVRGPDAPPGEVVAGTRVDQINQLDNRVGEVLAAGPNGADYVVLSMSDSGTDARLRVAVARGPRFGPGMLESLSTRQPGLIQAADITATALWLERHELPEGIDGRPLEVTPALDASDERATERWNALVDLQDAATQVHELVEPFFIIYGATTIAFFFLAWLWWTRRRARMTEASRLRYLDVVEFLALWTACVPAATFIAGVVPWWRLGWPLAALVGTVAIIAGLCALIAHRGPWRRYPAGAIGSVSALTAATIATDVVTGSHLQLLGLMGLQPVGGGRFYGMGNVAFALFATAMILLAAVIAAVPLEQGRRSAAVITVATLAVAAVAVDGLPFWGADAGGPPALIAGFAILLYAARGRAITWRRFVTAGLIAVLLVALLGVADWLRPVDQRTHLGDYVQRVIDGTAWGVITDKASANLAILAGADQRIAPIVPIVLLVLLAAVVLPESRLGRPLGLLWQASKLMQVGVISVLVCLLVGMIINDSGVAVAAAASPLLFPLLIGLQLRMLHGDERGAASTRAGRSGRARLRGRAR